MYCCQPGLVHAYANPQFFRQRKCFFYSFYLVVSFHDCHGLNLVLQGPEVIHIVRQFSARIYLRGRWRWFYRAYYTYSKGVRSGSSEPIGDARNHGSTVNTLNHKCCVELTQFVSRGLFLCSQIHSPIIWCQHIQYFISCIMAITFMISWRIMLSSISCPRLKNTCLSWLIPSCFLLLSSSLS